MKPEKLIPQTDYNYTNNRGIVRQVRLLWCEESDCGYVFVFRCRYCDDQYRLKASELRQITLM